MADRIYTVELNGQRLEFQGPEGATPEQLQAVAQNHIAVQRKILSDPITQGALNPAGDLSLGQQVLAGAGKALTDIGRGAAQLVGYGPTKAQTQAISARDASLMHSAGGLTGNIAGNVIGYSPLMLLPGGQTVAGAGTIGSTMAALSPAASPVERLAKMGIGFGLGSGAQFAGTTGARLLGEMAARNQIAADTVQAQNAVRDAALKAGRAEGYVAPPSTINPNLTNSAIESLGGKIGTQQGMSVRNQQVTDTLGRKALGLTPTAPLSDQSLSAMRKTLSAPYREIKALPGKIGPDAQFSQDVSSLGKDFAQAAAEFPESTSIPGLDSLQKDLSGGPWSTSAIINKVRLLRSEASAGFRALQGPNYPAEGPKIQALAQAKRDAADALDALVERNLAASGNPGLSQDYQAARQALAKNFDINSALTPGGHIDASVIAKIGQKKPLTGDLRTIADWAGNFGKTIQTGERVGSPMVHAARPAIGSAIGAAIGGIPGAAVGAGAGVAIPWAARQAMMSQPAQNLLATPSYDAGLLANLAQRGMLPSPGVAGLLSRAAVPAYLSFEAQK